MIVPAITMKSEIESAFDAISYTTRSMYYEGCIETFSHEIKQTDGHHMFAIISKDKHLVGYISYRVDWYCSQAYCFGLMCFDEDPKYKLTMALGIKQVIEQIKSYNLHRIEFRGIGGNPALRGYKRIIDAIPGFKHNELVMTDYMKDRQGNYHDCILFELIREN